VRLAAATFVLRPPPELALARRAGKAQFFRRPEIGKGHKKVFGSLFPFYRQVVGA